MVVALAGDLVTAVGDFADQLRKLIGDPTQNKERRLHPVPIQECQRTIGILLQPRLEAIPLAALDHAIERPDLKVIFQGDREDVAFRFRIHRRSPTGSGATDRSV